MERNLPVAHRFQTVLVLPVRDIPARNRLRIASRRIRFALCLLAGALVAGAASPAMPQALASKARATTAGTVPPPFTVPAGKAIRPFQGRGMWIWMLSSSDGGRLGSIIAQAKAHGVSTLFIKSGDGTSMWSQFNRTTVAALHHAGLRVCAWQYVYGNHPVFEADVGVQAVRDGANCLVIDAEVEYQGKYVQAQAYIRTLRKKIGYRFPIGLAGFPWVDYHPAFPYSVFLGPHAAQVNVPQMYWKDIGTTVVNVYAHTYQWNELYQRPIAPLGQLYSNPPLTEIRRFRAISRYYRAPNVSWWDWQSAGSLQWNAMSQAVGTIPGFVAHREAATVGPGSQGDWVVWAQEHLISAGYRVTIDGDYGTSTTAAVERFQTAHGLPATGELDPATWDSLLRYHVATVTWVTRKGQPVAETASGARREIVVPRSAHLRERRDELAGAPGRGRP
ncbi:MAG TPA: peptidoglycan-binding domain-containing protein [Solirubrobacteraceae bacterium]|nr:peptidoglycan-binding domain-containing protein [Solirubrobacteraceae bacterium]